MHIFSVAKSLTINIEIPNPSHSNFKYIIGFDKTNSAVFFSLTKKVPWIFSHSFWSLHVTFDEWKNEKEQIKMKLGRINYCKTYDLCYKWLLNNPKVLVKFGSCWYTLSKFLSLRFYKYY